MSEADINLILNKEIANLVGTKVGPVFFEIEKGAIKKVAMAIEDSNPLWLDEEYSLKTKYGSIIAPPTFIAMLRVRDELIIRFRDAECPLRKNVVDGSIEIEFFQPIRPGDIISVEAKIVDIKASQGKKGWMLLGFLETVYRNAEGIIVVKTKQTVIRV